MSDLFSGQPILLLFILLALGTMLGRVQIRGIGLGPAGVLFAALAFSASNPDFAVPEVVGTLGLALFAYTIGLVAGPSFFASLRTGFRPVAMVFCILVLLGLLTWGLGRLLGLDPGTVAGLYAGAGTNTPGLAAAIVRLDGSPAPTVGYSISYVGGVLIMFVAATTVVRRGGKRPDPEGPAAVPQVHTRTIAVTRDNALQIRELRRTPHGDVLFSRHRTPDGELHMAAGATVLQPGDLVHVIGADRALDHLTRQLGELSDEVLYVDRKDVDFRRIVVSNKQLFGRTIHELQLWERFGARPTRVRRADQDLLATDGLVVQPGDRIRVAAPADQIGNVATYLGDSEHATSDINPLGLATGLTFGLLLGAIPFTIPGLGALHLGSAAGPLIVGLVLGRLGRTGRMRWTLPHSGAETLTQLGLLLFLAYAGGRAGSQVVNAITSPLGLQLLLAGALITAVHAAALLIGGHYLQLAAPRKAGIIAGSQTQPAILAYANEATGFDQRVTLGYAMVYPVAMIAKIIVCQILTMV